MTTRRQSSETRTFRQEAFASSSEYERGILGNLVAARCSKLTDREEIAMIWWLQQVSWREGGIVAFAERFLSANQSRIGTPAMHRLGIRPGQVYRLEQAREVRDEIAESVFSVYERLPLKGDESRYGIEDLIGDPLGAPSEWERDNSRFPSSYQAEDFRAECTITASEFASALQRAMVDPGCETLRDGLWNFPSLWDALLEWRSQEIEASRAGFVETDIALKVFEELDFTLETKSFVLIEGREGIGKSEAAKNWVARHPGRAVYVRLESGSDESSMFRSIARAIGTACSYSRKTAEMRARLQDALQARQLMLVLDESHFLFPQSDRAHRSAPKRLDWLRTAVVDFDVPVALISTPQYFANACEKFRLGGWNANQIQRRLTNTVNLPETPSEASVIAVARHYFPEASRKETKLIAGAALISIGFLTTIVHLRKRVDFLSSRRPEVSASEHLKAALAAYIAIPEPNQGQPGEGTQEAQEARKPARCTAPAVPMHPRFAAAETPFNAHRAETALTLT